MEDKIFTIECGMKITNDLDDYKEIIIDGNIIKDITVDDMQIPFKLRVKSLDTGNDLMYLFGCTLTPYNLDYECSEGGCTHDQIDFTIHEHDISNPHVLRYEKAVENLL